MTRTIWGLSGANGSPRRRGRKPSDGRQRRRLVPILAPCEQRLVLSTSTWIGGAHLNADKVDPNASPVAWSNPENWLGGVPGPGDTAVFSGDLNFSLPDPDESPNDEIPNAGTDDTFNHPFNTSPQLDFNNSVTIVIDGNWTGDVQVLGGVTLTLVGSNTWDGGALGPVSGGTLINPVGSTLTIQNPSSNGLSLIGTLTNQGVVNADGGSSITMDGATIDNQAGATFNIQSNQGIGNFGEDTDIFNNSGLLEQTVGTGTTNFVTTLNNTGGTIDVHTGTFEWNSIGGLSTGGVFDADPGAVLQYGVGSPAITFEGTYTGGGGGGEFVQKSGISVDSTGATFDFAPGFYHWNGGIISGTNGTGTLTNTGSMTLGDSNGTIDQSAMNLVGGVTLDNKGTLVHAGLESLVFGEDGGATLINEAGATCDFESDAGWGPFGADFALVENRGLFEKTAGTGATQLSVTFDNQGGTLSVQSGTLEPWNGNNAVSTGATFLVASGATLQYNSGINSGNTFTGTYTTTQTSNFGQFVLNSDSFNLGTAGATFDFPSGFFQWAGGGVIGGGNTLTNAGFITVDTSDGSAASFSGTIINDGTITVQDNSSQTTFNGGTIDNPAGSIINLDGTSGFTPLLNATVNNSGTINSNSSGSVSIFSVNLTGGTIDALSGALSPWNNGNSPTNSDSTGGLFEAAAGASIQWNGSFGSDHTFTGTYTGSGAGQFVLDNSNPSIGAAGATFDFPSGFFQWLGSGSIGGGTLTNTGFITVDASNGFDAGLSSTLVNDGTMTIKNNDAGGSGRSFSGGTIDNPAAGVINLVGTDGFNEPLLNSTVNNSGLITGDGTPSLSIGALNLTGGTLDALSGTLVPWINNGVATTSTGGVFEASAGAAIQTGNGGTSVTLTGTYTGSGAGQVVLTGGTLTIGAAGATFDFPSGFFQWIGNGSIGGGNTLTNTGFITVDTSDGNADFSGTLINEGALTIQNGSTGSQGHLAGGTIDNPAGRTIQLSGSDDFHGPGAPMLDNTINNFGLIVATSSSQLTIANLNNPGTLEVQGGGIFRANTVSQFTAGNLFGGTLTGGTWKVLGGSSLRFQQGVLASNDATVLLDGAGSTLVNFDVQLVCCPEQNSGLANNAGSFALEDGATFTSVGTLTNTGTVTIGGNGSMLTTAGAYSQSGTGSQTILQGGTLQPLTSTTAINGGIVSGFGSIQGDVTNAAVFEPGTATGGGTIAITEDYTQTSSGALDINLGGASAGQFSQLAVAGTANLNGALNIALIDAFVPIDTNLFPAVTYAVLSGTFPTVTGTSLPDHETLTTDYTGSSLTLGITADVTAGSQVNLGGLRFNRVSRQFAETVTITNTSGSAIGGAISFVFDDLTSGITLVGATGVTQQVGAAGSSYINVVPAGSQLGAGQSVTFTLFFTDPTLEVFSYKPRVLAGLGQR